MSNNVYTYTAGTSPTGDVSTGGSNSKLKGFKGVQRSMLGDRPSALPIENILDENLRNEIQRQRNELSMGARNPREFSWTQTPLPEELIGLKVGDSVYDEDITSRTQLDDLNNTRGELQPWYHQVLSGVGKGAVLAGTTFVEGTVGLVYGLGALATGGEDGKYALSDFWNNSVTQTLDTINKASEQWMPNYYTNEEIANQQNGQWYKNIFTANFLGDSVLKNIGFIVGAAYSGKIWAGLASKALQVGKVRSFLAGAADVNNTEAQAVFNGTKSLSQSEVLENGARIAKDITRKNLTVAATGAVTGALGESSIEAYGAADEFRQGEYANIEQSKSLFQLQAVLELERLHPGAIYTEGGQEWVAQRTKEKVDDAKAKVEELAAHVGNFTFGFNMPLLTFSNMVQFGKFFSGGYKTGVKEANKAVGSLVKNIVSDTGEITGYEAVKKGALKTVGSALKNAATEANEEMSQSAIARGAKLYGGSQLNDYTKSKVDPLATEEASGIISSLITGFTQAAADPNTYQEGLIGGLFGFIGMPSVSKVDGKLKVDLHGGALESLREDKENYAKAQKAVQFANNAIQNGQLNKMFDNFVQHSYREQLKQDAIDNKDPFEFKNAEHKQLIETIINYNSMGKLDILESMADAFANAKTSEDVEALRKESSKANEQSIFDGKTDEEVLDFVHKQAKQYKDTINQYKNISENLQIQLGDKFKGDDLEHMTWMFSNIDNLESRFKEGWDKINKDVDFKNAIKEFTYKDENGVEHKLADVFETSPIEAIRMLSRSKANIAMSGIQSEMILPQVLSLHEHYQLKVKEKDSSSNRRGINSMQKKLDKIQDILKAHTDLGTKYNEYILNIKDFEKIATTRADFINKYNKYLYNPSSLSEDNEAETKAAAEAKTNNDVSSIVELLNKTDNFEQYKKQLDAVTDPTIRKKVLEELEKSDNKFHKQYHDLITAKNRIEYYIDSNTNSNYNLTDKQTAKELLNIVLSKFNTAEEIMEPYNYMLEMVYDLNGNDVNSENAKRLIQEVIAAIKKKELQAKGAESKVEGLGTELSDPNIQILPIGAIASGSDTSDILPNQGINTSTSQVLTQTNNGTKGDEKNYLRSAIPAVDEESRNNNKIVRFADANPNYTTLYNYLTSKGAFTYIQQGKLSTGSKIHFAIDLDLATQMEAESKLKGFEYSIPILMMHGNQVIGLLDASNTKTKYKGLVELRTRIEAAHTEHLAANPDSKSFIYKKEMTNVAHIFPGIVEYTETENNLSQLFLNTDNTIKDGMILGVMGDNGIEVPNKQLDGTIINPTNPSSKKGRIYLLTKGADGKYYPSLVQVNPSSSLEPNSIRMKEITKIISQIAKINSAEELNSLVGLLNKLLYLNDINISYHTGDNGPFLFINRKLKEGEVDTATNKEKEERKVYLDTLDLESALELGGPVKTNTDTSAIEKQILDKIIALNPNVQINKDSLNTNGYHLQLLKDGILTTNIDSILMEGGWFITDTIDPDTLKTEPALKPQKAPVTTTTNVLGVIDPSFTKVTFAGNDYYIDLVNNEAYTEKEKDGQKIFVKILSNVPNHIIIDLARIKSIVDKSADTKKLYEDKHVHVDGNIRYMRIPGTNRIVVINGKDVRHLNKLESSLLNEQLVNDILDKKATPVATKPAVKNKTTTVYVSTPSPDGSFTELDLHATHNPTLSLWKLEISEDGTTAEFSFANSKSSVNDSVNAPQTYIHPVAEAVNALNQNATKIITVKPGTLKKVGSKWVLQSKAMIMYGEEKASTKTDELVVPQKSSGYTPSGRVIYTTSPSGDTFTSTHNEMTPGATVWAIDIDKNNQNSGNLFFANNESGIYYSLNAPHTNIEPVAEELNSFNQNATKITTVEPGRVELRNGEWVVTKKAKIAYGDYDVVKKEKEITTPTTSTIFNINSENDAKVERDNTIGYDNDVYKTYHVAEGDTPITAYVTLRTKKSAPKLIKAMIAELGEIDGVKYYYTKTQEAGNTVIKVVNASNGVTNESTVGTVLNNDILAVKEKLLDLLQKNPSVREELNKAKSLLEENNSTPTLQTTTPTNAPSPLVGNAAKKFGNRFAPKPRVTTEEKLEVHDVNKELDWLKRILPNIDHNAIVKIHQGLIKINNKNAWGMYQKGVITLSDIAAKGTLYHEAFHLILDTLATSEEKEAIFAEAKAKWGNLSENELEEKVAEEFRMYVTIREENKSLGKRILNFFKSLLGLMDSKVHTKSNMYKFFDMVNEGKLANRTVAKSTSAIKLRESIKPGVQELFESNPALASIGSQQQYSQYLDTIFPDSKVKDIVYHGTRTVDTSGKEIPTIEKFDKSFIGKRSGIRDGLKAFYFGSKNIANQAGTRIYSVLLNINDNNIGTILKNTKDFEEIGDVFTVNEPEQIHILGSKQDIEGFKEFVKLNNINTQNLEKSIKNTIFADLNSQTRKFLEMKGFTDTSWEMLNEKEKENEIKCVMG